MHSRHKHIYTLNCNRLYKLVHHFHAPYDKLVGVPLEHTTVAALQEHHIRILDYMDEPSLLTAINNTPAQLKKASSVCKHKHFSETEKTKNAQ